MQLKPKERQFLAESLPHAVLLSRLGYYLFLHVVGNVCSLCIVVGIMTRSVRVCVCVTGCVCVCPCVCLVVLVDLHELQLVCSAAAAAAAAKLPGSFGNSF